MPKKLSINSTPISDKNSPVSGHRKNILALGRPRGMVWGGRRVQDGEHMRNKGIKKFKKKERTYFTIRKVMYDKSTANTSYSKVKS